MKALVYHGPNKISLDDVPMPQIMESDDVIIKVTLSAICTSDVHVVAGHLPDVDTGKILGHEFCGEIVETGSTVKDFQIGDRVMVRAASRCGSCDNCLQGRAARFCLKSSEEGHGIFGIYGPDGCQAEYMRLPHGSAYMTHIPEGLNEEDVVLVTDMLSTGMFAAMKARISEGDTVVVVGCGPVGLSSCAVARLFGAKTIIAVDILDYPLEAALKAGVADYAINNAKEDVLQRVAEKTGGQLANVVIETAGLNESFNTALSVAGVNGRVCTVALFSTPVTISNMSQVVLKNLEIITGIQESEGQDKLLAAIQAGSINHRFMLTHKSPLNDIQKAYEIFSKKQDNCIKWLLTPYER